MINLSLIHCTDHLEDPSPNPFGILLEFTEIAQARYGKEYKNVITIHIKKFFSYMQIHICFILKNNNPNFL